MKKLIFLAAVACVALAGCTKKEAIQTVSDDTPIAFSPIAQKAATKAQVYGEQNATYTAGTSPSYEKFLAYAAYTEDASTAPSVDFFPVAGVECVYNAATAPADYWAPATAYYWPKAGFLTFRAFSPSALAPCSGTVANTWASGITIADFVASTDMDQQVDVLYSDTEAYKQRSMYNPENGALYDDKTGDDNTAWAHSGVNLTFRHALSSVQFRVITDQDYAASATAKHEFTVTKIEVLNVNNKGSFNENRAAATGNAYANAAAGSVTFNKDNSVANTPYWTPTATEVVTYPVFSGTQAVATTGNFGDFGKAMLPMPQLLGGHGASADQDVTVKVTYNYTFTLNGTPHSYTGLTTQISLAGKKAQKYNGATEEYTVNQWLINHKYLYTLVFKLDPIIFDPKVEAFVEVSDINIDLPYQNI